MREFIGEQAGARCPRAFLTNCVVAARVVVCGVLLARDELLRVVQVAVRAGADLVDAGRLQINHKGAGHELAGARLSEEGVEAVVFNRGTFGLLAVCVG
jgi:hypothetical protein